MLTLQASKDNICINSKNANIHRKANAEGNLDNKRKIMGFRNEVGRRETPLNL